MNILYAGDSRRRSNAARIWRMAVQLLGALDTRMTANLDCRARLMLYGKGGPRAPGDARPTDRPGKGATASARL